jgi:hypothetical protein
VGGGDPHSGMGIGYLVTRPGGCHVPAQLTWSIILLNCHQSLYTLLHTSHTLSDYPISDQRHCPCSNPKRAKNETVEERKDEVGMMGGGRVMWEDWKEMKAGYGDEAERNEETRTLATSAVPTRHF